jgi:RNA polymerase sigma-70 factor, ECF subfamily
MAEDRDANPKELMKLAKSGDNQAFGKLYELYFTPVFKYVYFRVKDSADAEDITQTVFLKVFRSISNFKDQNVAPLSYFFTIARNTIIDGWRTKKEFTVANGEANVFEQIPDTDPSPLQTAEKNETGKIMQAAIQKLTDDQKEVIILKFINGLSNKEISPIVGKSEEAIRQIQCRALVSLRNILKSHNDI